jgi:light-independent protochlorophyllide reductase subunit B
VPALHQGTVQSTPNITVAAWDASAENELKKIPFFVRGKARRNTEKYAIERGVTLITTETLYESKAYYSQS